MQLWMCFPSCQVLLVLGMLLPLHWPRGWKSCCRSVCSASSAVNLGGLRACASKWSTLLWKHVMSRDSSLMLAAKARLSQELDFYQLCVIQGWDGWWCENDWDVLNQGMEMFKLCCGSEVIQLRWSSQQISSGNGHVCHGLHSCGCAAQSRASWLCQFIQGQRELLHPSLALGKAVRLSRVSFELLALKSWE